MRIPSGCEVAEEKFNGRVKANFRPEIVTRNVSVSTQQQFHINLLIVGCHLRRRIFPTTVMILDTRINNSHWHDINVIS